MNKYNLEKFHDFNSARVWWTIKQISRPWEYALVFQTLEILILVSSTICNKHGIFLTVHKREGKHLLLYLLYKYFSV